MDFLTKSGTLKSFKMEDQDEDVEIATQYT